jgi:hypothetical protein
VSQYLVRGAKPGVIVRLGGVEGTFTLPDRLPAKLLLISAAMDHADHEHAAKPGSWRRAY